MNDKGLEEQVDAAHSHSIRHRDEILSSRKCGCFYCLKIFTPSEINEWCDPIRPMVGAEFVSQTAKCPSCGIDSVIGDASGFEICPEFLGAMNKRWF